MRVILTTDVPKIGNKYDLKEFKDGYANVLIARGVALLATPKAIADLNTKKANIEKRQKEEIESFDSLISSINNTKVEIKVKTNEKGHLFKAVSPHDVVTAIKEKTGVDIEEDTVRMEHIKEVGTHIVEIKKGNRIGKCELIVISK